MHWAKTIRRSLTLSVLLIAVSAAATTIVMPTDDQLIEKSPTVLVGSVLSRSAENRDGAIWTETAIRVERTLKGSVLEAVIIVEEAGGVVGNRRTVIFGSPDYQPGERVLVFLLPSGKNRYRTRDLFAGKFTERVTTEGRRVWLRPMSPQGTMLLDQSFRRLEPALVIRDRDLFEQYVIRNSNGTGLAAANYLVCGDIAEPLHPSFSLIEPPEVYRWFEFEEGNDVEWHTVGIQSGYSDGGLTELVQAMHAWNDYEHALIRYTYTGPSPVPAGGLFIPNGINEVMFEDPLDEIDGGWGGSGVLGRGGFNQVADETRPWTSGFHAGDSHPRQTYQTWVITEGNLVIQNGVRPSTSIDPRTLATLLAHELGHTLGIGHTGSPGSLMNASLRRIGPVLASDDEDAARWLYPNGPFPERPEAPDSLDAKLVGPTTVLVSWSDNSDNEDVMILFLSRDNRDFSVETELGPNKAETTVAGLRHGSRYQAYVVAWNLGGSSDRSNLVTFDVPEELLEADFSMNPNSGIAGVTSFRFVNESSGSVATRVWSFGDGWTSESSRPSHIYALPGTYTVTLTLESLGGQRSSASKQIAVSAIPEPVAADFVFSPEFPKTGQPVAFEDRSTGTPTWWRWSFGEGATSSERNPLHQFSVAGIYEVVLEVGNEEYASAFARSVTVESSRRTIESILPVAGRVSGVGATSWRTDLSVFNPWEYAVEVEFQLIADGALNGRTRTILLSPGSTQIFEDSFDELFDLADGVGAIRIVASSEGGDSSVRAAARIFTESTQGSFGQFVGLAEELSNDPLFLTGLRSGVEFRTNLGGVNPGDETSTFTLHLLDEHGDTLETSTLTVRPQSFFQHPLAEIFPSILGSEYDNLSLSASSDRGPMHLYASVVDNRSNDPILHQATRSTSGNRLWIPVVGKAEGTNQTFWISDISIFSPSDPLGEIDLNLLQRDANQAAVGGTLSLGRGGSLRISDVIEWLGLTEGSGALEVTWKGDSGGPVAVSKSYTRRPQDLATFGQAIGLVTSESLRERLFLTGIQTTRRFRTNVGFFNTSSATVEASVALLDRTGTVVAERHLQLSRFEQRQQSIKDLFPSIDSNEERFSLKAEFSAPTVFLYASVTDNDSGDPVFIAGR